MSKFNREGICPSPQAILNGQIPLQGRSREAAKLLWVQAHSGTKRAQDAPLSADGCMTPCFRKLTESQICFLRITNWLKEMTLIPE